MHLWCVIFWWQFKKVSSSRITGSVGVKKASKGDTIFFYNARNSPGQYDLSRINHLHSSFVPEDVPDAASEKDLVGSPLPVWSWGDRVGGDWSVRIYNILILVFLSCMMLILKSICIFQGNEFFKQKKFKEARDCYSRSIALSPTAVAYANRAMANIKLRRQAYVLLIYF